MTDGAPDAPTALVPESRITLEFRTNNQVSGFGGCNGYGGRYEVKDDGISFSEILSTLIAWENDTITRQEQAYFSALGAAQRYGLAPNCLTIWYDNGKSQLEFVRATPDALQGTRWQLVSYGEPDTDTPALSYTKVTLEFQPNNRVGGSGGCNSYGGTYTLSNNTIAFGQVISTLMACADTRIMEQEQAFYTALQTAGRYEVAGDRLTIWYNNDQERLDFKGGRVDALPETKWQLTAYGVLGIVPGATLEASVSATTANAPTLEFLTSDQIAGFGGCNNFSGHYEVKDGTITFSAIVSTKKACLEDAVTQQEQTYFNALQSATRYAVSGNRLVIWYENDQQQLVFTRR